MMVQITMKPFKIKQRTKEEPVQSISPRLVFEISIIFQCSGESVENHGGESTISSSFFQVLTMMLSFKEFVENNRVDEGRTLADCARDGANRLLPQIFPGQVGNRE